MTANAWPLVPLGEILSKNETTVTLAPTDEYREVTIRLWGKGVVQRRVATGAEIAAERRFQVFTDQFIVSRIDARNGAMGVVPPELDGAVVTNDFPSFEANRGRLLPVFLGWLSKTHGFVDMCRSVSEGTTNRVRLKEDKFLRMAIPLPPLEEQRRLVAKIDRLATRIEEAALLKNSTAGEIHRFWKVLSRIARTSSFPSRPLADVVDFLDGRRIPLSRSQRANRKGPYPYYGASGIIDYIDDFLFDEPLLLLSEDGANLINRTTPIAFVAEGRYWVNNHAHVLKPRVGVANLRFLAYALADYDVEDLNFASAQAKLNQKNASRIWIPVPPLQAQVDIVRHLDRLHLKANDLTEVQSQTQAELDAMLPSVLDRAFKGAL